MNTNDTNWTEQSPPLVTHSTYQAGHYPTMAYPAPPPPVFHPAPPQPRRRGLPSWSLVLIVTVSIAAALVNGLAAWSSTSGAVPESCLTALDEADQMGAHFGDLSELAAEAVEAAAAWDVAALESITADVEDVTADLEVTVDAYVTARDACRAEGGAL